MSPEQFLQVADLFPDAALFLTGEGTILAANRGVGALGFSPKALVGRGLAELTTTRAEIVRDYLRRCIRSGSPQSGTLNLRVEDDRMVACRCHAMAVPRQQGPPPPAAGGKDGGDRKTRILLRLVPKEHSETFRVALANIGDAVITTDADGRVTFLNPVAESSAGRSGAPPQENAQLVSEVIEQLRSRGVWSGEFHNRRRDGRPVTTRARITALEIKGKSYWVCVQEDITERKRAEDALRASEQRFAGFMRHLPGLAWIKDPHGRYVYANDAAEKAFQTLRADLYGKTDDELFPPETAAQFRENDRRVLTTGASVQVVETLKQEDGLVHYSLVNKFPVPGPDGKPAFVGGMAVDITNLRRAEQVLEESEERFRQLAENIEEVFWMSDPLKNKVLYVSPAYEQLWGRSRQSLYDQPLSFLDGIHPDDHAQVVAGLESQRRGEPTDLEYQVIRPDGSVRWVRDRSFPIRDRAGRVYRVAGIAEDVTDRRRFEEDLQDADRRKDDFLAMLAHEMRNPLAPVQTALDILKLPGADAAVVAQARETMERQVEYMVRLVDDLLDVSRIMRGKIELRRARVDLAAAVARAVETSRPSIDAEVHRLTVAVAPEPLWVDGDLVRLAQVVSNLLNNAAKYTQRGGEIRLAVEREGDEAVLRVHDTGVGIAPEVLPRIFDMFFQADRRTKNAQGGMGIGLTLVKSLVEMHGGRVDAHSDGPGKGSEFMVRLPLLKPSETGDRAGHDPSRRAQLDARAAPPASRRVLVVDDNAPAAETLAIFLRLEGHDVTVAHDGQSALERAAAAAPEVALVDIGMPQMDGCELARRFRADPALRNMVLVALTGWGQDEDRRRTRDAGFDLHLVKPVESDVLRRLFADPKLAGS
jgi:PAS domain S-box-containing protein